MMNKKGSPANPVATQKRKKRVYSAVFLTVLVLLGTISITEPGKAFWKFAFRQANLAKISSTETGYPLNIHVLDVGKADAILIECQGHSLLLDGGTCDKGDKICDYLTERGIGILDYIVASHPDRDHIGSLAQVIQEHGVKKFIYAPVQEELLPNTREYQMLTEALKTQDVPCVAASPGYVFSLGDAKATVFAPLREYDNLNDSSLILQINLGQFSALFCGDIEQKAEADIVDFAGEALQSDLLKIPHHGSNTSASKKLLRAVQPQYAVISTGRDNNRLPKTEVLQRLENFGVEVYRTDIDGTVIVSSDGEDVSVTVEWPENNKS